MPQTLAQADENQVLEFTLEAGRLLLASGAEAFRAQQTMQYIAQSYGLGERYRVYVLTNGLFASLKGVQAAQVVYVPGVEVNLTRVEGVNALSRRIAEQGLPLDEAFVELHRIEQKQGVPFWGKVLACGCGAAGFCVLFGGTALDVALALLLGVGLQAVLGLLARAHSNKIITQTLGAALAALAAVGLGLALPACHPDRMIISALMRMTPGVSLTMGIRDFVSGDYLSGSIRLLDALLVAGCLAFGVGAVLSAARLLGGVGW